MVNSSLSNFTSLINTQIDDHTHLSKQLVHIHEVLNFTLSADLSNVKASELHAQLSGISDLLQGAEKLNQQMQSRLEQHNLTDALSDSPIVTQPLETKLARKNSKSSTIKTKL